MDENFQGGGITPDNIDQHMAEARRKATAQASQELNADLDKRTQQYPRRQPKVNPEPGRLEEEMDLPEPEIKNQNAGAAEVAETQAGRQAMRGSEWAVNLVPASSIAPVSISWLWPGWLALGKLIILAGAGGSGKTTLLLGLIATLTSAGLWPDRQKCERPGNAIIWTAEDDPADTIIPRLIAAGADLHRVHIIQGRLNSQGQREPFDPATDIDLLSSAAERIGGVQILMIDPVVNAVKGDLHKANEVRRNLQKIVDFAETNQCAVVGISHFAKGTAGNSPAERVIGSQAFTALARTVLVAAKQEDSESRVLAIAKSNIHVDDGGVEYTIEPFTIDGGIETTRVQWGDKIEGTCRDILSNVERVDSAEVDTDDPADSLRRILQDGPISGREAKKLMESNGFTTKQIRRAREKLGLVVVREGFGRNLVTYWSLDNSGQNARPHGCDVLPFVPKKPIRAHTQVWAQMGKKGTNGGKEPDACGQNASLSPVPPPEPQATDNDLPADHETWAEADQHRDDDGREGVEL